MDIYFSLRALGVGWGSSVGYETLNSKQVFYQCASYVGWMTGVEGPPSDHIQLPK